MKQFLAIIYLMTFFYSCKQEADETLSVVVGTYTRNLGFVDGNCQ